MDKPIELNSIKLFSHPEVYFPREDSILLSETVKVFPESKVLDLGCGTGFIGLIAAKQKAKVLCSDINLKALELTKRNAEENKAKV
jgi:methylase of polypeptide subunit release factors